MTGVNVITLYYLSLVLKQVGKVLRTSSPLTQLSILYLRLNLAAITELLSLHMVFVWKILRFVSPSVSVRVTDNFTNALYGNMVNIRGNYGLSCKRCPGRTLRHNDVNNLVYLALLQTGLPLTKEPARLSRTDGKHPDDLINMPWQAGKSAIWEVTITDTLADSYLRFTSRLLLQLQ